MKLKLKNNVVAWLAIALVLVLIGSIAAQAFNTSGYTVNVSRIYFDTERGTLSGLLYLPKGASAEDPRPTVVTTHGYLNSAEMQDAPAIELSRRGYVVLALDMYDHGHSKGAETNTGSFLTFWPYAIFDAATYMYGQDFVMKDENGNGVIAVSGHSMGGFSSSMALYFDELAYEASGVRMIAAGLSAGSDYSYTAWLGLTADVAVTKFGGRTIGKIAGQFDEFFFNAPDTKGTVNQKNYVGTDEGKLILGQEAPAADTWYDAADGGKRIIYQPYEIHPWNHFSTKTTGHMVDFYKEAFAKYDTSDIKDIPASNQIWLWKEIFECVALVGFLMLLGILASLLLKVPFLKKAISGEAKTTAPASSLSGKIGAVALFLVTMLIPAIIFPTVYDNSASAESMRWLYYAGVIAAVVGAVALVMSVISKAEDKKCWIIASAVVVVAGAFMAYLTGGECKIFSIGEGKFFQAGVPTSIAIWALVCSCITVVTLTVTHMFGKKDSGVTMAHYGLAASPISVVASAAIAIIVTVAGYGLLFLVDLIFKTDFRIWTFAFKTFEASIIPASLKYVPFFLIYYLASGVAALANTSSLKGWKGYAVASLTNMGGITLWLILQYGMVFATGSAFYPGQALSGILLFALVPTLVISSCYSKYLYNKTGNVYLPAFLNALVLTIMTVANTTVYWQ